MAIELRHLRYAVAAAQHRSFRRAAEALNLKQSTLSRRIHEMECYLGVALFERSRAGVRPTVAGDEFLRTARHIVQEIDAIIVNAKAAGRGEVGRLAVGFYTSLSGGNLRATLIDYAERFPQVEVRMVEGTRVNLFTGLKNGSIDIAIVTGDRTPHHEGCCTMPLWCERIIVALPEHHPLAEKDVVYWGDLKGETFLLARHDPGPDVHDLLVAKLASPGERPRVVQHDASREAIKNLVGAGFGIGLVFEGCTGAKFAGVVYREAHDGNGPSCIGYRAHWEKDNNNPALAGFLKLLEERYSALRGGS